MPIGQYSGHRLKRLHDRRFAELGNCRDLWERISFYIMPQQRSFTSEHAPGDARGAGEIYDSTAIEAAERLSTRIHESLTNPASQWFQLEFADEELNDDVVARTWLDACEDAIRSSLRVSNFEQVISQIYLDLVALGTGVFDVEEKNGPVERWNGLKFCHHHLGEVAIGANVDGAIDYVSVIFKLTAEQIVQRWAEAAPERIRKAYDEGMYDEEFPLLLSRFERSDYKQGSVGLVPQERRYAAVWTDYETGEIIEDDGTYERAALVARWRLKSGEIVGYGPGERALPTVRTLNEAERLEFAAWATMIDPPIRTTTNNVVGDLNLAAKGVTVLRKMDDTAPWDLRPDLNHHMIQLEDKRYQVRSIFHYHQLELPAREQVGQMTAYEVQKRTEQLYRALGPTVLQLQADVLNPLIQRVFGLMYRKQALPEMPLELAAQDIEITYVGPLVAAQKSTELEAVERFVMDTAVLAKYLADFGGSEALDILNVDALQKRRAQQLGVPAVILRTDQEIEEIREERAELAEQEQEARMALSASEAMANVGKAVGQDTLAAEVAQEEA